MKKHSNVSRSVTSKFGTSWYLNGKLHRYKKPAVIRYDGSKAWYIKGLRHRTDGPAIIWPNNTLHAWYFKDKRHREYGPALYNAVNIAGLADLKEWYLDDIRYTENGYWAEMYKRGKISKKDLFLKLL